MRSPPPPSPGNSARRHRWGLIALAVYLLVLATIKLLILGPGQPVNLDASESFALAVIVPAGGDVHVSSWRCSASALPATWPRASRCIPPACSRCR